MESFDLLPLSCIINGKFIAVHGGISPDLKKVKKYFIYQYELLINNKARRSLNN